MLTMLVKHMELLSVIISKLLKLGKADGYPDRYSEMVDTLKGYLIADILEYENLGGRKNLDKIKSVLK